MRRRSCQRCRIRKLKCGDERPCKACQQAGIECQSRDPLSRRSAPRLLAPGQQDATTVQDHAMLEECNVLGLSRTLLADGSQFPVEEDSEAIPGSHGKHGGGDRIVWRRHLKFSLPATPTLELLIDAYFQSVNWFMMVVIEDTFRSRAKEFLSSDYALSSNQNFVHLMSLVIGMGAHYLWTDSDSQAQLPVLDFLRKEAIQAVESAYFEIVSRPDILAVQIAILLGSFHLFNGKPYLGFSILGSGVKCAQAIGLHRQSLPRSATSNDHEACCTWWALEIFEKYASVAFGLPCSIDDSDVNVPYLNDLDSAENQHLVGQTTYHQLKCKLYRIMGPFLGRRRQAMQLQSLPEIHAQLIAWYSTIPDALSYEQFQRDRYSTQPALIQMQAVALHLAYDNLQIVLHRHAVLPQKDEARPHSHRDLSLQQLYQSAIRTATALSFVPTDRICRSSHAAMHVGICSFSAGVLLCALLMNHTGSLSDEQRHDAVDSINRIIILFENFPGQNYRLAVQSLQILKALQTKLDTASSQTENFAAMPQFDMQADMFGNMLQSVGNTSLAYGGWPMAPSVGIDPANTDNSIPLAQEGVYNPAMTMFDNAGQMWLWNS